LQDLFYRESLLLCCSYFKIVAQFKQLSDCRTRCGKNKIKAVGLKTRLTTAREFGGREGARTPDLLVANEALSQLSYTPIE
jgi:hypothetical protein